MSIDGAIISEHGHATATADRREAWVARGNIYLSFDLCERYLPRVESVALVCEGCDILVVPLVSDSAGGMLLKMRNAAGDRVVHAQEFFRTKGFIEDFVERLVDVRWSDDSAALLVCGLPVVPHGGR